MPTFSRIQLLVYGAVAVAVLLVGARWVRGADDGGSSEAGGVAYASGGEDAPPGAEAEGGFAVSAGSEELVVHVAGAVHDPGVYRFPAGSRVTDAVERAGGVEAGADADSVNLAATLADGQQVVIPGKAPGGVAVAGTAADGPISLGSATAEQLDTIDGIGPVTAQSILNYRDEQGGLASVDELDQVSGIGPATMEALRGSLQP